jgi:hypothetical protein
MQAKYQLLQQGGVLSFAYDTVRFSDIGGMHRLKRWREQRQAAFKDRQELHGLDAPKGILLHGRTDAGFTGLGCDTYRPQQLTSCCAPLRYVAEGTLTSIVQRTT